MKAREIFGNSHEFLQTTPTRASKIGIFWLCQGLSKIATAWAGSTLHLSALSRISACLCLRSPEVIRNVLRFGR